MNSSTGSTGKSRYSWYALGILWMSIFFNYADRQIISVLAESVKRDLSLTDAQLGMLYGTTFVVLYTIFALVIGRLADSWSRTKLLALGMAFWSVMTASIGLATNFAQLVAVRSGVGIGEATANPCNTSLISDYFPKNRRGLALSIYLTGMSVGTGCSALIGAGVALWWDNMCTAMDTCFIKGWQAAFLLIGIAGLPVAILAAKLREPRRGQSDAIAEQETDCVVGSPWQILLADLLSILPIFNLPYLFALGFVKAVTTNLIVLVTIVAVFASIGWLTNDWLQWGAVGVCVFAIAAWGQCQFLTRPDFARATLGSRTFWYLSLGCGSASCAMTTVHFWAVPYAMRTFGLPLILVGGTIGGILAIGAAIGMIVGGILGDKWSTADPRAAIWIAILAVMSIPPTVFFLIVTEHWYVFVTALFVFAILSGSWAGPVASFFQSMVRPVMRSSTASLYALIQISFGLSFGPYAAGKVSEITGSLSFGLMSVSLLCLPSVILLTLGLRDYNNAK